MKGTPYMHLGTRHIVATGTALAILVGGGGALAATAFPSAGKHGSRQAIVALVAGYLGLSAQQLRADLAGGQTLAQIASAKGRSVSGLEQTIESAVKARLDQGVKAGRISGQREEMILSRLQSRLDVLVNQSHPGALLRHRFWRRGLLRASAAYLGLTAEQLKTELRSGKTLAQIATAQGKAVAGLKQAIQTAVKARLDKAVAAGRISAQAEQRILAKLNNRLDALVNHSFAHA